MRYETKEAICEVAVQPSEATEDGAACWRFDRVTLKAYKDQKQTVNRRLAVDKDDVSPYWYMYPDGYDPKCGACWLGIAHTADYHRKEISRG